MKIINFIILIIGYCYLVSFLLIWILYILSWIDWKILRKNNEKGCRSCKYLMFNRKNSNSTRINFRHNYPIM